MQETLVSFMKSALSVFQFFMEQAADIVSTSPAEFGGGALARTMSTVLGTLSAVSFALLNLFWLMGVIKSGASLSDLKRPEVAVRLLVRYCIAKSLVTYSGKILNLIFSVFQGIFLQVERATGFSGVRQMAGMSKEVKAYFEDIGTIKAFAYLFPVFLFLLIACYVGISVLITVYVRFFKIYFYEGVSNIAASTAAGESTQNIAISFLRSFCGVGFQGLLILLSFVIFNAFAASIPEVSIGNDVVITYIVQMTCMLFVLKAIVSTVDQIANKMLGL